ncbi:4Fe-4S single cluster domain protein [Paraburkholderia xenovorans LB400]|uniref:Ferredoxin n=1 Tax=Paraburkholderia xenovorans (strain LB400) TaxID=266265 RepID=Q13HA3_PARXL|nr:ferredoxin [Paraburkholderia xenovorans]ABE36536.1 Ferredoxin [Paraburkholderia xenovorans LB400]AIP34703.1 4Fe-4S single cluster domain protein [Paraburkholderia xenovorans LB400]
MGSEIRETAVLYVRADRSRCCGYGLCAQLCPQVYKLDENGIVYLESDTVPRELESDAREGAAACPAEALTIEAAGA